MKKKGSVLAGDVGGTRTVLSLFKESKHGLEELREETFSNRDRESIDEILKEFLGKETTPPQAICLGVAGTVNDGKSKVTNLPWELDESALARSTGVPRVKLLNDLEASAYGMLDLGEEELCILNRGAEPAGKGNIAVIAAGTGLGEAILYWDGEQHQVVVSEGGHADFAPRNRRGNRAPEISSQEVRRSCELRARAIQSRGLRHLLFSAGHELCRGD